MDCSAPCILPFEVVCNIADRGYRIDTIAASGSPSRFEPAMIGERLCRLVEGKKVGEASAVDLSGPGPGHSTSADERSGPGPGHSTT